jgi:dihydroorotate dehydrogenase (NAD+) catalytic subunit
MPDLSVDIGGLKLKNPIMTASGTFGYGEEYAPFINLNDLGAIIVKGLSLNRAWEIRRRASSKRQAGC